jgi:hypothetical protein
MISFESRTEFYILNSTFPYGGLKNINDGFVKILIVKVVVPAHCPAVGVNV